MVGFGQRLRRLRKAYEEREPFMHGQGQWAYRPGISESTYNRWENGTAKELPKLIYLNRITDLFQVSMDYLLRGILPRSMDPWLRDTLRAAHPELLDEGTLADQRRRALVLASQAEPPKRKLKGQPRRIRPSRDT